MKKIWGTIAVIVIVGTSGLVLAQMTGRSGGCCSVHNRHTYTKEGSTAMSAKTIYTCPMHPEIKQDHPGDCPKCGMHLEPVKAT